MAQVRRTSASRRLDHLVIVYDVADDRRRTRVANALLDCGVRVGYSVFELRLSVAQAVRLLDRVARLIDTSTDRVHLYRLCSPCADKAQRIGVPWGSTVRCAVVV